LSMEHILCWCDGIYVGCHGYSAESGTWSRGAGPQQFCPRSHPIAGTCQRQDIRGYESGNARAFAWAAHGVRTANRCRNDKRDVALSRKGVPR
jgi:hypothetical protein